MVVTQQANPLPARNLKRITTYVEPEVYEQLVERAKTENRTVSNMAATILVQSVVKNEDSEPSKC